MDIKRKKMWGKVILIGTIITLVLGIIVAIANYIKDQESEKEGENRHEEIKSEISNTKDAVIDNQNKSFKEVLDKMEELNNSSHKRNEIFLKALLGPDYKQILDNKEVVENLLLRLNNKNLDEILKENHELKEKLLTPEFFTNKELALKIDYLISTLQYTKIIDLLDSYLDEEPKLYPYELSHIYFIKAKIFDLIENYNEAEKYYYMSLDISNKNPIVNIEYANFLNFKGKYELAKKEIGKADKIYNTGKMSDEYILTNINTEYGDYFLNLGDLDKSTEYFENVLKTKSTKYDLKKYYRRANNGLGHIYWEQNEFKTADKYFKKYLDLTFEIFRNTPHEIAGAYTEVGSYILDKGEIDKAIDYHLKALEIIKSDKNDNEVSLGVIYLHLGMAQKKRGSLNDINNAIVSFKKSEKLIKEKLGNSTPELAGVYSGLGQCFSSKGMFIEAISYLESSIKIDKEFHGDYYYLISTTLINLSFCYYSTKKYQQAKESLLECLSIREKSLKKDKTGLGEVYMFLGDTNKALKLNSEALNCYKKALKIYEVVLDKNNPIIVNLKKLVSKQ